MLGGVCVDTGTIPSKTFREAVISLRARRRRRVGAPARAGRARGGRRPSSCWRAWRGRERARSQVIENQLRRNDVDVIRGEASFVDPHTPARAG